jgi:uncharacterized protein YdhG (YjbR/CyaY superfamily)
MQRFVDTPAEYVVQVPEKQRPLFDHLRNLIQTTAPEAREEMRYGMLVYDDTGALFGLAAQKHYVGLYVLATQALTDLADDLAGIDHGKGCLRFKKLEKVPTEVIARLLTHAKGLHERDCERRD